ncbi:MAG TPA: ribbon-helix-helix domain-containing protein [Solirubrobacteraceae bacterium]|jgi:hypothetical protein|nr:ribbon-helix-helix domain-containing protein [Solirubrobacteraceae bacterium]
MKRTTVSLPDDLAQALEREAARLRTSVSAVTRAALGEHLGLGTSGPRELPFTALGHSGHHTTGRDMEQLLHTEWE